MQNHGWKLLRNAQVLLLLLGCAHSPNPNGHVECVVGELCQLEGKLELFPGQPAGAALLIHGDNCTKLALPDSYFSEPMRGLWHDQWVSVEGRAFAQPALETDLGVLSWYSEKERKVATGMCDADLGIYVQRMNSSSGSKWPASTDSQ